MNSSLKFHPQVILRTPAYPFHSQFDEPFIQRCLDDPQFREALYLASPALHDECLKWRSGLLTDAKRTAKLMKSLVKYYCRTSSRCTPFGLFAGCSVVDWHDESQVSVSKEQYYRHTRLDMHYLTGLVQHLAARPAIREKLLYFANTSIYQLGDEIRYVEYQYVDDNRVYQISSVTASDHLLWVLESCAEGVPIGQLVERFAAAAGISLDESRSFIDQLVESQLLVNELEPSMTGKEFFHQLLAVLKRLAAGEPEGEVARILHVLKTAGEQLKSLDAALVNDVSQYESIIRQLRSLDAPLAKDKVFQVDLSVLHQHASLDRSLQDNLLAALKVLYRLSPKPVNEDLEYFKSQFTERYGDREVPLLEVLDEESGIGYSNRYGNRNTALTEDLELNDGALAEQTIEIDQTRRFIHNKLLEAQKSGSYSVEITAGELDALAGREEPLPPSMSVIFRVVDHDTVLLEGAGGASGANLLGRFAHTNPQIKTIVEQLTGFEQQANPGVLFAEVNHLPQGRTGNILSRPVLRQFEIPYLTVSSLPRAAQLPPGDLFVSVQHDRVTLRSRRLNQIIVPRISTAYNWTYQSLPVYHFLGDLQAQELQPSLSFNWEVFISDVKFLPRVTFRQTILHLATWYLDGKDLRPLLGSDPDSLPEHFRAFREAWNLPRLFTLADGDNELLVDANNLLTVKAWLDAVKNESSIRLKEFLFNPASSVVTDGQGRPYVNQFVALLLREQPSYPPRDGRPYYLNPGVQQKFWPGAEWLYYKLYCGVKASDRILTEAIGPLVEALVDDGLVDQWFFVRYADPGTHLRVRFHLTDVTRIGEVVLRVNQYLKPYLMKEYIWKSQTDTYVQERERYGYQAMELSERLFYHDSLAAIAILEQTTGDEHEPLRWLWGVRSVDELLDAFGFTLPNRQKLLGQLKEAFGREFNMNKSLKLQLDAKYRNSRTMLRQFLDYENDLSQQHPAVFAALGRRNDYVRRMAVDIRQLEAEGKLGVNLYSLVGDHLHMVLNRLIPTSQRLHEMVIYDFLYRHYQGQAATQNTPFTAGRQSHSSAKS